MQCHDSGVGQCQNMDFQSLHRYHCSDEQLNGHAGAGRYKDVSEAQPCGSVETPLLAVHHQDNINGHGISSSICVDGLMSVIPRGQGHHHISEVGPAPSSCEVEQRKYGSSLFNDAGLQISKPS